MELDFIDDMLLLNDVEAEPEPPTTMEGVLIEPCGSQYTCNPKPPLDYSDVDFLVYCPDVDYALGFEKLLAKQGYKLSEMENYDDVKLWFLSWKKHVDGTIYNYIVTTKKPWYHAFIRARNLCKELNLMDKKQRIAVHEAFLDAVENPLP